MKKVACADEKRLFVSFNIFSTDKINHVGYENVNVYTIDIGHRHRQSHLGRYIILRIFLGG